MPSYSIMIDVPEKCTPDDLAMIVILAAPKVAEIIHEQQKFEVDEHHDVMVDEVNSDVAIGFQRFS